MANNLRFNEVQGVLDKLKIFLTRIYRPGMSPKGFIQNSIDYVGDKNVAIGTAILSALIALWSFSLFTILFAIVFSILATITVFVIAKFIFYL